MNAFQMPIERTLITNSRIRPPRKKKRFHKTNPLVKIRQFPTFGDIKRSVEPQEINNFQK